MLIEKQKIIFLHPGKTGGTSVEHELRDLYFQQENIFDNKIENFKLMFGWSKKYKIYLQHADLILYDFLNIDYKKYETFVSIRGPYERILSCFFYSGQAKLSTFDFFVENILEKKVYSKFDYCNSHFCPQISFYKHKNFEVKNIIKLENFKEDCKKIGLTGKYHYSKTNWRETYKKTMEAYNQKTKDIVYNLYKEDFLTFDYAK
jgi:hypothetical protein